MKSQVLTSIQETMHREIPLSSFMKVSVVEASSLGVTLRAPLAPNGNHQGTAFGGSVHTIAVLSCWLLVSRTLEELKLEGLESDYVVIQDSQIDYVLPIDTDLEATSFWPTENDREKFLTSLRRKKLGRATVRAEVKVHGKPHAKLTARFAAQVRPSIPGEPS